MRRTGVANLPLHYGSCPRWLFDRMKNLAGAISEVIVYEYSREEFLKRMSDPFWFQSFACVLGFDWHSSGVTTTVTGALKEALKENDLGLAVCGGKGKTSRKTPQEIVKFADAFSLTEKKKERLVYSSKMSAKVDNTAIQDGYNLYHHCFIFNEKGEWVVIQQGMNYQNRYARRYHWLSGFDSFVDEPHSAICCDKKEKSILNMVARESRDARDISVDLVKDGIQKLSLHRRHDFDLSKQTITALTKAHEINPNDYEELLAIRGIGPKAIRALALISQLIYGKEPSWNDPVKFSFAVGGKDGIPFEIDRKHYDNSIEILRSAIENAKLSNKEKLNAIKKLHQFIQ